MELWIKILPFFALITFTWCLQGIPTWICLGISSPFINFHGYQEVLVNDSISLNITKDEQALMHQEGLKKMGSLIKPNHIRDAVTGYVKANYTKKIQSQVGRRKKHWMYSNAVQEELDQKQIYILDEDVDENGLPSSLTEEDKKFIVPMALKTPGSTAATTTTRTTSTTTTQKPTTTASTAATPDYASNINELKNHILFLQNMTKHDTNFQSKFVVFPGMQKDRFGNIITPPPVTSTTTTTTKRTTVTSTTVRPVPTPPRQRFDDDMMSSSRDKITIIPQVLLLNDQSPPDDADEEVYGGMGARKKDNKLKQQKKNQQRKKDLKRNNRRNLNPLRACVKNPTSLKCERQKKRLAAQQAMNSTGTTTTGFLQRSIRSHKTRNINWESFIFDSGTEYTLPSNIDIDNISELTGANQSNQTVHVYTDDDINLNPENCQKVPGFTYGQRKLCLRHISVMPAISRGARAAIQECQHQFRNRRWNCSTTEEDSSVFGTVSAIGSPEMAFVYALSSAMVTSFLARSCRDGQLPSCGCSRGSRPNQLNDEWSWGGCGDNLDFAYRFSQEFVDIKERERKRGTRGLSALQRSNFEKDSAAAAAASSSSLKKQTNSTVSNANVTEKSVSSESENKETIDPTIIRELQERITKEILNSKLQEKDMQELKEKINKEILNSALINSGKSERRRKQNMQNDSPMEETSASSSMVGGGGAPRLKNGLSAKARSQMNLHNNEAGRRAVLRKSKILCKCHGVSGSCSLITCWQQLSSIREIGDYLREKYEGAIEVKLNKRGQLQVRHEEYKVQTPHDLVYLDDSPDWCRVNKQLQWPGTHGRVCNKTSSGLDGCGILCCGRGYNTKTITDVERCNCKFHWCCQVKCETCVKVREEHTCK